MKKTIMIFHACAWVGAAFGSNNLDGFFDPGRIQHQAGQQWAQFSGEGTALGRGSPPSQVISVSGNYLVFLNRRSGLLSITERATPSAFGNDNSMFELCYVKLLPEMQKKWEELSSATPSSHRLYVLLHTAALEPEDVKMLAGHESDVEEIVDAAAKRFAAHHKIPDILSEEFSLAMGRKPLHDALVSLVKNACAFETAGSLQDFNEAALTRLLTNLFLVNENVVFGNSNRGAFLRAYLCERDDHKAANLLLQGKVKEETLAGLSLPLKLRATCLKDAEIDVEEALTRVMPMEEERALAILSFLRTHPLLYSQFWEAEKELSQTYIAWFAAHVTLGFDVSTLLLKYGELSKKRRRKLLDLPYPSQRIVRIKKWLREKDASL